MKRPMLLPAALIGLSLMYACEPAPQSGPQYDDQYHYNLRDTGPAGGLIFHINANADADGWKYLEAGPADLTAADWGGYFTDIPGADGVEIGTGPQNTLDLDAYQPAATDKAAGQCVHHSIDNGGVIFDDWFLPSRDELNLMFVNLQQQGVGGFDNGRYWSSSESGDSRAWLKYFSLGEQYADPKTSICMVRPARRF